MLAGPKGAREMSEAARSASVPLLALWQDQYAMERWWQSQPRPVSEYHPLREFDQNVPGFHREEVRDEQT